VKRTAPDREAIEAELYRDERKAVAEWCELRGIPVDAWPQHSGALGWLDLAIGRAVKKARKTGRATSRKRAMLLVCGDFGLDGESVRRRWARTPAWRKQLRIAASEAA
jgi:hypothetical protein